MPPNFPNDTNSQYIPQLTILLQQSINFNKFCAIDTYPDQPQKQCIILTCQNISSIYTTLQQQFENIIGYQINFQTPTIEFIKFIQKINQILKQFYYHIPLYMIFKSQNKITQEFYQKYIITNNQQLSQNIIKNSQKYTQKYLQNIFIHLTPQMLKQYPKILQRKLNAIQPQVGNSKLQPLFTMMRQLHGMFGFEIKAQKNKNINKVIIKYSDETWYDIKKPKLTPQNPKKTDQKNKPLYSLKYSLDQIKINLTTSKQLQLFLTDIISQLLQHKFLTGKSYPKLNPLNIECFIKSKNLSKFTISPYPIINQNLSSQHNTYINPKTSKFFFKQTNTSLDFSQQGNITNCNQSLIILIHYIETSKIPNLQIPNPFSKSSFLQTLNPNQKSTTFQILNIQTHNDQLPNLLQINNLLLLNCHLSDLSILKSQYILWLRYKIMQNLYSLITKQTHQNIQPKIIIEITITSLLTAMDYQQLIHKNQKKQKNKINLFINKLLQNPIISIPLKLPPKTSKNTINYLTSLTNQITYLHKNISPNKFQINFSKQIHKILSNLITNFKHSLQQSNIIQIIIKISIKIIFSINQSNIIYYHHTIYQKLIKFTKNYQNANKTHIIQFYQQLKGNQELVEKRIWWGNIWDQNQDIHDF